MNNNKSQINSGGIGFIGLLTIVFIVLKLTHILDWSWWWVLSPLWVSFGVGIIAMIIMFIVVALIPKD